MSIFSWIKNRFKKKTLTDTFSEISEEQVDRLKKATKQLRNELPRPIPQYNPRIDECLKHDVLPMQEVAPIPTRLYGMAKLNRRNVYHVLRDINPDDIVVTSKCGNLIMFVKDILKDIPTSGQRICKHCYHIQTKQSNDKNNI